MIKQRAHEILESVIHRAATTGEGWKTTITIPYYELLREIGFSEKIPDLDIRITIKAEFVDDNGDTYGSREAAIENKTSN